MPNLSNKAFDFLKWFAIIGLHLLGAAYAGLATEWGWPYATQVGNTLDIIGVLLGAFLAWENYDYKQSNSFSVLKSNEIAIDAEDIVNGI